MEREAFVLSENAKRKRELFPIVGALLKAF